MSAAVGGGEVGGMIGVARGEDGIAFATGGAEGGGADASAGGALMFGGELPRAGLSAFAAGGAALFDLSLGENG
jgi:hypothetical protein